MNNTTAHAIAILGCGRISESHLQALTKFPEAKLVCFADTNPEAARTKAEKYGAARWVTDYHELLAEAAVEAVVVCVPTFLHAEVVCAAAAPIATGRCWTCRARPSAAGTNRSGSGSC